jgi:dUTP pyrophosphatase
MSGASGGHCFLSKAGEHRVRYVRGTITAGDQALIGTAARFQPIQHGGYIDGVTGLQWKAADDGDMTWYDAMGRQAPGRPYLARGFELVTGYCHNLPERSTEFSAGYDFFSPEDVTIHPNDTFLLKTGVKAYMKPGEVLKIYIRSSFGRDGLELKNKVPVIDCDFYDNPGNEGNITLMLKNTGTEPFRIQTGEKVVQGIFLRHELIDGDSFEQPKNARNGGIGSTGK